MARGTALGGTPSSSSPSRVRLLRSLEPCSACLLASCWLRGASLNGVWHVGSAGARHPPPSGQRAAEPCETGSVFRRGCLRFFLRASPRAFLGQAWLQGQGAAGGGLGWGGCRSGLTGWSLEREEGGICQDTRLPQPQRICKHPPPPAKLRSGWLPRNTLASCEGGAPGQGAENSPARACGHAHLPTPGSRADSLLPPPPPRQPLTQLPELRAEQAPSSPPRSASEPGSR